MPKITGGMRQRLDGIIGFVRTFMGAGELDVDPADETPSNRGCTPRVMLGVVVALGVIIALYVTGRIAYDFTLTPEERASDAALEEGTADSDIDPQLPGEPYLEGRHYAISATGGQGTNRIYTFELLGEGDSGAIRVWEDETGRGSFTITDSTIKIEMERMVPAEAHAGWEPNVFEGTMSEDRSRIGGTWTRRDWTAFEGKLELGEWVEYGFSADRL